MKALIDQVLAHKAGKATKSATSPTTPLQGETLNDLPPVENGSDVDGLRKQLRRPRPPKKGPTLDEQYPSDIETDTLSESDIDPQASAAEYEEIADSSSEFESSDDDDGLISGTGYSSHDSDRSKLAELKRARKKKKKEWVDRMEHEIRDLKFELGT
jgi:hypothetical protein